MQKSIKTRATSFFTQTTPKYLLPIISGQKITIPSGAIYGQSSHTVWYGYKTAKRTYEVIVEYIDVYNGIPVIIWRGPFGKYHSVDINKLPWWEYEK